LRARAMEFCRKTKRERILKCDCAIIAVNHRVSLDASTELLSRLWQNPDRMHSRSDVPVLKKEITYRIALYWGGVFGATTGTIIKSRNQPEGPMKLQLPEQDTVCTGTYSMASKVKGAWSLVCGTSSSASG